MRATEIRDKIADLISILVVKVRSDNAMGRYDINRIIETILVPIFRETYGYKKLVNLNSTEEENYPAIDLGDESAKVAIQVTSTASRNKIIKTIESFKKYELYKKISHLKIYIITEKQKTYSQTGINKIIDGEFNFEIQNDVLDYRDLLKEIKDLPIENLEVILRVLEANLGDSKNFKLSEERMSKHQEKNYLNLVPIKFPQKLYLADLSIDKKEVIRNSKTGNRPLKHRAATRELVKAAMSQAGLRFSNDWICHEDKIVTFHNLREAELPLASVIDPGTITPIDSDEFYEIEKSYESIFKSLLWRCLQQFLYQHYVSWQYEEKIFIFSEIENQGERKESWIGKKRGSRVVFSKTMRQKEPSKISYCKHLGFKTKYERFGEEWFASISPTWFFSFDGYKKSFHHHKDKTDWLKRNENDKAVCNHLRFIAIFLKEKSSRSLLSPHEKNFLSFGDLLELQNPSSIYDQEWLPPKTKQEVSAADSSQMRLDLEQ